MILFDLRCQEGHGFEAWFRDGDTYDDQAAAGIIACPVCGDTGIAKAPMAPRIAKGARGDARPAGPPAPDADADATAASANCRHALMGETRPRLEEMCRRIEENCDPVGDRFAEEARRIHYGEVPRRDIYGRATEAEARELAEEGVEFAQIPWPARTDS